MREQIGGYRILSEIGSGGFGAVYRARDPLSGKDVALKALTKITNPSDLVRFRREARLAYEIGDPNIIRILHYGEDGGVSFIVMELMPISLRERLGAGRLSLSMSLDICRQAALGLNAAHKRNVIHRDVKPDNILLDSEGAVKITDFGLARAVDLTTLTATGDRIGTPLYMSPEQWKGERADARSDIYSLGAMLYETLTGEAPFLIAGKTPIKQVRPSVPTGLERIVEKCTELDPSRRYQTMDELLESISLDLVNRCALIDFYEATGGPNWKRNDNWLTDAPLNEWHGIDANSDGVVVSLYIQANNLVGRIPSEIAHLTELEWLYIGGSNGISESIPPEIGSLPKLKYLSLSRNSLAGSIPPEIGSLTKLKGLSLSGNVLAGSIPPEIGSLNELEHLFLSGNVLAGSIPTEIGNLTKLKYLNLSGNVLAGSIPTEIGNLTELKRLGLSDNSLTGGIPTEIGNLTELERLYLGSDRLSGSIPPEIGSLAKLESLVLSDNRLSGSIPPEIGSLAELKRLRIDDNRLSGSIPPELGNLTKLERLYISGNNWTRYIPSVLFNIPNNDLDEINSSPRLL